MTTNGGALESRLSTATTDSTTHSTVDTGFGRGDVADPKRLGQPFRAMVRPALDPAEWRETRRERRPAGAHDSADFSVVVLERARAG